MQGELTIPVFGREFGNKEKSMIQDILKTSEKRISVGAWVLIGLQFLALVGLVTDGQQYDPAIESFLSQSAIASMQGPFDFLVAKNILPVVAIAAGLTLWKRSNSSESRKIISTGAISIILGSILVFF
jgi:hypothetical protein